jgi:hypothetical protein
MGEGIGKPYKSWKIKFDRKTLESAMKALKMFAAENLVINNTEASLRPNPFQLFYTKDKEQDEKPLTWLGIENSLRNSIQNSPGETEEKKQAYFKNKIIARLDNLQAEEKKKVVSFPKKKKE